MISFSSLLIFVHCPYSRERTSHKRKKTKHTRELNRDCERMRETKFATPARSGVVGRLDFNMHMSKFQAHLTLPTQYKPFESDIPYPISFIRPSFTQNEFNADGMHNSMPNIVVNTQCECAIRITGNCTR